MINASIISDEDLEAFDDMMTNAVLVIEKIPPLAVSIWAEVLRELDVRGRVQLLSGTFDDFPNAKIRRLY